MAAPPTAAAAVTAATYRETSGIEGIQARKAPVRRTHGSAAKLPVRPQCLRMSSRRLIGRGLGEWLRSGGLPGFADQYLDRASGGYGQKRRHEGTEDPADQAADGRPDQDGHQYQQIGR